MKKKACKTCKIFIDGDECPVCKGAHFATNWKGRIYVLDANKSNVAKKVGLTIKG